MTEPSFETTASFGEAAGEVPGVAEASDLVGRFMKALKGCRLYLPNNRILLGFISSFCEGVTVFIERYGDVCLRITQFRITYEGETVYENQVKEESLAFRLFIHGVREISFHEDVPEEEITAFLGVIHRAFDSKTTVDDLLSLLWEEDFQSITFIILDDFFEEGEQAEFDEFVADGRQHLDHASAAPHLASQPLLERTLAPESDSGECAPDLPSMELSDAERSRLSRWVEEETNRDLSQSLMSIVLEILADMADPTDSIEILGVLNRLLDTLLEEDRIREAVNVYLELRRLGQQGGDRFADLVDQSLARLDGDRLVGAIVPYFARCPTEEREGLVDFIESRGRSAIPLILDLLPDPDLKETAIAILKEMAEHHLPTILEGLRNPRPEIVAGVARMLGNLGDIRAISKLRIPLHHEDMSVRRETIRAIEKFRSPAAVPILTEVLSDPAPEIRVAAVQALAALPSDRIKEPLVSLSQSKDFMKRTYLEKKEVFLALGRLRDPEIESWLIRVLKKRSLFNREAQDELRACAVAALAHLGTEAALKAVRSRENDKSPQVRRAVSQALRKATDSD